MNSVRAGFSLSSAVPWAAKEKAENRPSVAAGSSTMSQAFSSLSRKKEIFSLTPSFSSSSSSNLSEMKAKEAPNISGFLSAMSIT